MGLTKGVYLLDVFFSQIEFKCEWWRVFLCDSELDIRTQSTHKINYLRSREKKNLKGNWKDLMIIMSLWHRNEFDLRKEKDTKKWKRIH